MRLLGFRRPRAGEAIGLLPLAWVLGSIVASCGGGGTSVGEGIAAEEGGTTGGTTGEVTTTDPNTPASSTTTGTTTGATALCTPDTYTNFAANFFTSNCVSCHSHDHSAYSTYAGVMGDASIPSQITQGSMPLGATLDATTKSRILAWFTCKLPQ